jgi:acyl dehydratase
MNEVECSTWTFGPDAVSVGTETCAAMADILHTPFGTRAGDGEVPFIYPARWMSLGSARESLEDRFPQERFLIVHEFQRISVLEHLCPTREFLFSGSCRAQAGTRVTAQGSIGSQEGASAVELSVGLRILPSGGMQGLRPMKRPVQHSPASLEPIRTAPLTAELVRAYADASADRNPIHTDRERALELGLSERPVQGMLVMGLVEPAVRRWNMEGRIVEASARFLFPVVVGDALTITGKMKPAEAETGRQCLRITIQKEDDTVVCIVDATVVSPLTETDDQAIVTPPSATIT